LLNPSKINKVKPENQKKKPKFLDNVQLKDKTEERS